MQDTTTAVLSAAGAAAEQSARAGLASDSNVESADPGSTAATELVESDLLVEDVSIDGMCGVY